MTKATRFSGLVLLMFIGNITFAQQSASNIIVTVHMLQRTNDPKNDTIFYDLSQRLTWTDFQGKPVENHIGGAVTASGFAFNAGVRGENNKIYLGLEIFTFFDKRDSWKKKHIQTAYHLQHEQLHFDITRLGAEKFMKQIAKANFTKENYSRVVNDIFEKTYAETIDMQQKYDKETHHSINNTEQLRWNELISSELKKL